MRMRIRRRRDRRGRLREGRLEREGQSEDESEEIQVSLDGSSLFLLPSPFLCTLACTFPYPLPCTSPYTLPHPSFPCPLCHPPWTGPTAAHGCKRPKATLTLRSLLSHLSCVSPSLPSLPSTSITLQYHVPVFVFVFVLVPLPFFVQTIPPLPHQTHQSQTKARCQ